jgi:hypothetical protein
MRVDEFSDAKKEIAPAWLQGPGRRTGKAAAGALSGTPTSTSSDDTAWHGGQGGDQLGVQQGCNGLDVLALQTDKSWHGRKENGRQPAIHGGRGTDHH